MKSIIYEGNEVKGSMGRKNSTGKFHLSRFVWVFASSFLETVSYLPGLSVIRKETVRISSKKIPASFDGFRILVLADLHGHKFGKGQTRLLKAMESLKPNAIVMAGDWVREEYEKSDKEAVDQLIEGAVKIAPFYGAMGNHEYYMKGRKALMQKVEKEGGTFLLDQSVLVKNEGSGECIKITGLDCFYQMVEKNAPPKAKEEARAKVMSEYQQAMHTFKDPEDSGHDGIYTVVLGHRPELLDLYADLNMDLVFSGHAHGGLMRLPFGKRLLAPDQGLFPTLTHGVHQKDHTTMVISEGLGGPRIFIRPHVLLVELQKEKES